MDNYSGENRASMSFCSLLISSCDIYIILLMFSSFKPGSSKMPTLESFSYTWLSDNFCCDLKASCFSTIGSESDCTFGTVGKPDVVLDGAPSLLFIILYANNDFFFLGILLPFVPAGG